MKSNYLLFGLFILLISCKGTNEKNESDVLNQVSGKYYREFKEPHGSYYLNVRDTIIVIQKDQNFEIQNRQWFISSDKPKEPYFRVPGFRTYQGTFNKIDTTISRERGGSIKFDLQNNTLSMVDHPGVRYKKAR